MNIVRIQQYRLVKDAQERTYVVYVIKLTYKGHQVTVERRYREFHALHRKLKKIHPTPYFPPKKVLSVQEKILKQRKEALEYYLQAMLKNSQSQAQIYEFLGLNSEDTSQLPLEEYRQTAQRQIDHYPVFGLNNESMTDFTRSSTLGNIITEGVLLAVYKS